MTAFDYAPWPKRRLGDLCLAKETIDPARRPEVIIRYIDISCVSNESYSVQTCNEVAGADAPSRARKLVRTGDVIFATTRPYLRSVAAITPAWDGAVCSTGFCVIRPGKALDPDWAFFLATSKDLLDQVTPKMRGASYPAVSDGDVLDAIVPLPPLLEQRRIVARIRAAMARVDEVRALRGETAAEADVVEAALVADLLSTLPAGTPTTELGKVLSRSQYGTSQKASLTGAGVPVYRMGNIQRGRLVHGDMKTVELPPAEIRKYALRSGDILINRTNSLELVGKAACVGEIPPDAVFASYLVRLIVNQGKALPEFVSFVINSRVGREYVLRTARRAIGMVNINSEEIAKMPIPLPPLDVQRAMAAKFAGVRQACDALRGELALDEVSALPTAILRKAFAGEL